MYGTFQQFTVQVAVKTVTRQTTGELLDTFSYTGQPVCQCRYIESPPASMRRPFGEEIMFDAILWTRSTDAVLSNGFALTDGQWQQVKVTDKFGNATLFNALRACDLAQFSLFRAIAIKRWA